MIRIRSVRWLLLCVAGMSVGARSQDTATTSVASTPKISTDSVSDGTLTDSVTPRASLPVDASGSPERKRSWLVIPGMMSAPETGPAVVGKVRVRNLGGVPGYVDATSEVTFKKQWFAELVWLRDSIGSLWRTEQHLEVGEFPDIWFGPGNPPPDSLRAEFTPTYLIAESRLARYLGGGWALEGSFRLDLESVKLEPQGAFLVEPVVAPNGGSFYIAGLALEYEGRDLAENPTRGLFLRSRVRYALPGSESTWSSWQNDLSDAASAGPFTLVGRVRSVDSWGDVPFWEIPALGYREALRGLPERRLRGEAVQCAGAELRYNLPKILGFSTQVAGFFEEGHAGTHGGVWSAEPTPAGGAGGRLLLDGGKAVLRVDEGISPEGMGFYIDFGQTF